MTDRISKSPRLAERDDLNGSKRPFRAANIQPVPVLVIEGVTPEIDGGQFAAKCVVGEPFWVEADVFKEGHDVIRVHLLYKEKGGILWDQAPMDFMENDRWRGCFTPLRNSCYVYTLEAWMDPAFSWLRGLEKKCLANDSVRSDVLEGLLLLKPLATRVKGADKKDFSKFCKTLRISGGSAGETLQVIQNSRFLEILSRYPLKEHRTLYAKELELVVDRKIAEFGAWYELFPRSQGVVPGKSGTFRDCVRRLPDIKEMGFDVIYLAPIHPIGLTSRKGPNNSLSADQNSPGSPWAIGSHLGGHKAVHPELGTLKDFKDFVKSAAAANIEIALDVAFQCSPDHPYVREHPEWFYRRPDGTIHYAENPPKKYQDIYPLNFHCQDWKGLWEELKSVILFWVGHGVKIFRVDNPHTKPLRFWKWLIDGIKRDYPEVIFLSEAFTRPKMMKFLAKAGFTQSYTYFTWRNTKWEIRQHLEELTQTDMKHYFRGNFFANTPDILHEFLQKGGRPAFKIREALAATLSPSYGIYSGFELCENTAKSPGSEEYLNSEKYDYSVRDWDSPGNIKDFIGRVNRIRRNNPSLQEYKNLEFYESRNENVICYGKRTADNSNIIVVIVNLDPFNTQEDFITLPIGKFGIQEWQTYQMRDLLNGEKYHWKGSTNYVRLEPDVQTAHIFCLKK
jgi:starch synthase (maltosyl-transferring)